MILMKKKMICFAASVIAVSLAAGSVCYAAEKHAFDEHGVMVQDAWYYNYDDNKWYYMDSNGVAVKGWQQVEGRWYYLLSNGVMAADGWRTIGSVKYYFDEDGIMRQNGYVGEKYLDSNGIHDSRYDIKVRGKTDKDVLEEAGNTAKNVPGWLLEYIFESGWKIACNAEKEDYGTVTHEDYSNDYTKYSSLETGRKLIFFIQPECILQGIGLYVNHSFGKPGSSEDFQGVFSVDWEEVSDMFSQQPIIEKTKDLAFAEVFALYYSEDEEVQLRFREDCPALCEYMDRFMAECFGKANLQQ